MKVKALLFVLLLSVISFIEAKGQISFRLILHPFEQTILLENKTDTLGIIYDEVISELHKKDFASGFQELKATQNNTNEDKALDDARFRLPALTYAETLSKSVESSAVIFFSIVTR